MDAAARSWWEGEPAAGAFGDARLGQRLRKRIGRMDGAIGTLRWHALRWKIEVFHKVAKPGCRAVAARLRTAERWVKPIALWKAGARSSCETGASERCGRRPAAQLHSGYAACSMKRATSWGAT